MVLDHCWCLVDSHRRCWSVGRLRKEARKQNRGAREGKAGGEENPWCCWKWWRLCWWWWTTRFFFLSLWKWAKVWGVGLLLRGKVDTNWRSTAGIAMGSWVVERDTRSAQGVQREGERGGLFCKQLIGSQVGVHWQRLKGRHFAWWCNLQRLG